MEETPRFIMKCPKCLKEFSLEVIYCEACSVMLEPAEIEEGRASQESAGQKEPLTADTAADRNERIADLKVGRLKTDVEEIFAYALFYERDQLTKRLQERERALQEIQNRKSGIEYSDYLLSVERKEQDIGEIMAKMAHLERTIEELGKTIEDEIQGLHSLINIEQEQGFRQFLSQRGRYCRRISSEVKMKNRLVEILREKRPPMYFAARRPGRLALLVGLSVVLTVIISWQVFSYTRTGRQGLKIPVPAAVPASMPDAKMVIVKKEDILGLLEDIKRANLNKDIALWESRYSTQYPELPGKKESLLEQWRNFDYRSMEYGVDDIKSGENRASAVITWNLELFSKVKKEPKMLTQRLSADFIVEDGRLKIRSVAKQ